MGGTEMPYNVDAIFQIAGIGIIVAMMHTVLKQMGKEEYAHWVTLIGFIVVLFMVVVLVEDLFQTIKNVFLFSYGRGRSLGNGPGGGPGTDRHLFDSGHQRTETGVCFPVGHFYRCGDLFQPGRKIADVLGILTQLAEKARVNSMFLKLF